MLRSENILPPWHTIRPNNKVYVANKNSGDISVIDGDTNTLTNTFKVGPFPLDVAVNPNTNTVYVAHTQNETYKNSDQDFLLQFYICNRRDPKQVTEKNRAD